MLFKEIVDARTDGRQDDRRRTMGHHKSSPWVLCAQVSLKPKKSKISLSSPRVFINTFLYMKTIYVD